MADTADLIRTYFAAFNDGDVAGMLDCLKDGVRHDVNQGESRYGKAAFAEFCTVMSGCYRERLTDVEIMVAPRGARAAAEFVVHGEYRAAEPGMPEAKGQKYVVPGGIFFEISDGLISRVTTYYNLQLWLKQIS